jgi:NADPH:quinone reductase-like Zn-dependent oxidoreductase
MRCSASLARARGARVIGTASEANHEFLRTLGAEPTTYDEGPTASVGRWTPPDAALVDLIEITGSPDNVVTTADFNATEHARPDTSAASSS